MVTPDHGYEGWFFWLRVAVRGLQFSKIWKTIYFLLELMTKWRYLGTRAEVGSHLMVRFGVPIVPPACSTQCRQVSAVEVLCEKYLEKDLD